MANLDDFYMNFIILEAIVLIINTSFVNLRSNCKSTDTSHESATASTQLLYLKFEIQIWIILNSVLAGIGQRSSCTDTVTRNDGQDGRLPGVDSVLITVKFGRLLTLPHKVSKRPNVTVGATTRNFGAR